jgi:hypothetical protein
MVVVPDTRDPLTALVHRLDDDIESCDVEDVVPVGDGVRLVRCRGELYIALVTIGDPAFAYWLDLGLGRLVWTLATAAPAAACERARRVLAEAEILTR